MARKCHSVERDIAALDEVLTLGKEGAFPFDYEKHNKVGAFGGNDFYFPECCGSIGPFLDILDMHMRGENGR